MITREMVGAIMALLEPLEQFDRRGPEFTRARRYTFVGTNTSNVDVLVSEPQGAEVWPVLRIEHKAGRYDGAVRCRLIIRWYTANGIKAFSPPATDVAVEISGAELHLKINGSVMATWRYTRPMVRGAGADEMAPIILWHWERWYRFLPEEDVRALAAAVATSWGSEPPTLAQCNRAASRALYRLARDLGWRKLTQREREKLALDSMWVRAETYAEAQSRRADRWATGAGEYSLYESAPRVDERAQARITIGHLLAELEDET